MIQLSIFLLIFAFKYWRCALVEVAGMILVEITITALADYSVHLET